MFTVLTSHSFIETNYHTYVLFKKYKIINLTSDLSANHINLVHHFKSHLLKNYCSLFCQVIY